jgi:hypothetical protein|tara:strand:+ start:392 stop:880 length:489 start_codon:yes stop_codon:yes gene_type:complete
VSEAPLPSTGIIGLTEGITSDGILSGAGAYGLSVTGIDVADVGDEGGWRIIASGSFPTTQGVQIRLQDGASIDRNCYGGIGNGIFARSADGTTLTFASPFAPSAQNYDLYFESEDTLLTFTLASAVNVVERSWSTGLYSIRRMFPDPRDPGPFDIQDEESPS